MTDIFAQVLFWSVGEPVIALLQIQRMYAQCLVTRFVVGQERESMATKFRGSGASGCWDMLTPWEKDNIAIYVKQWNAAGLASDDPRRVCVAHQSGERWPTAAHNDGSLPTFLAEGSQKLYCTFRGRWFTAEEKSPPQFPGLASMSCVAFSRCDKQCPRFAAMGWPATKTLAAALDKSETKACFVLHASTSRHQI